MANQYSPAELQRMITESRNEFRKGTLRLYANDAPEGQTAKPMSLQGQDDAGKPVNLKIDSAAKAAALLKRIRFQVDGDCLVGNRLETRNRFTNLVTDAEFVRTRPDGSELKPLRLVLNQRAALVLLAVAIGAQVIGLRPAQRAGAAEVSENTDFDAFIGGESSATEAAVEAEPLAEDFS